MGHALPKERDLFDQAQRIVDNQDGNTIVRIFEEYGDYEIVYDGDGWWTLDGVAYDENEIVGFVEELLSDLHPELLDQVIDYYA